MTTGPDIWLEKELAQLREADQERLLRVLPEAGGKITLDEGPLLNFASNDYLDLARHPEVIEGAIEAIRQYGTGSTASRLVAGSLPIHQQLEEALADYKNHPAALLFGSGYMTNAGLITCLVGAQDHVYADRLIHASILDAVKLSGAHLHRFRHNDPQHLREMLKREPKESRRLVVTESVFSMDGDIAPLAEILRAARDHNAISMVDEAHSTGVFGPEGRGLAHELGVAADVDISMGTLSKALGGYGGFAACSKTLRNWLINRSRPFIYTTAPPPSVAGAALAALRVIRENGAMGTTLLDRAARFRATLREAGLDTLSSGSQIIPVVVGESAAALALSARLRQQGLLAPAIRPPTVPRGSARLRLSVTLAHMDEDLQNAAGHIIECARAEGVLR